MWFSTRMWRMLSYLFLSICAPTVINGRESVGIIRNVSVIAFNQSSTIINATCDECLCALVINRSFSSSFNCLSSNKTCQVLSQSLDPGSFTLVNNTPSSFYFFSKSINGITQTASEYTSLISKLLYSVVSVVCTSKNINIYTT